MQPPPPGLLTHGLATVIAGALLVLLIGCGGSAQGTNDSSAAGPEAQQITVFAASSLQDAFTEMITEFESGSEGVTVERLVTDGSSTLATQLMEGAPADVFAAADERTMEMLTDAGIASKPETVAANTLVVAVPAGNSAGVEQLADLAEVTTVLCAPEVPCGAASNELLENAAVSVRAASYEQNVRAVLEKVSTGEADAGLVYASDVLGDDTVESFVPEGAEQVVNRYPIVVLEGAEHPEAAQAFVDFVRSPAGQAIMEAYGFQGIDD